MYFTCADCSIREYQSDFNSLCWHNLPAYCILLCWHNWWRPNNSNSQVQLTATSKQANHYKVWVCQQVWKAPDKHTVTLLIPILCGPSNSCNMGTSALPDIYALCLGHATPESKYRHIKQCTSVVLQLIYMLCYCHSKNLPKLAIDFFAYLYKNAKSLWLCHFNFNVSVVFIYTIDPVSSDYGILLMLVEK